MPERVSPRSKKTECSDRGKNAVVSDLCEAASDLCEAASEDEEGDNIWGCRAALSLIRRKLHRESQQMYLGQGKVTKYEANYKSSKGRLGVPGGAEAADTGAHRPCSGENSPPDAAEDESGHRLRTPPIRGGWGGNNRNPDVLTCHIAKKMRDTQRTRDSM